MRRLRALWHSDNKKMRIWSFINKTFLRFTIKSFLNLWNRSKLVPRIEVYKKMNLSNEETAVVKQLQQQGYAQITHLIDPLLLKNLADHASSKHEISDQLKSEQLLANKEFWIRLSDQDLKDNFHTENPFYKFALQEAVLRLATGYLGQAAFLEYIFLTLSKGSDAELKSSQLWHCDYDNVGMLKMFVYLTDVTEKNHGPFTFINRNVSLRVPQNPFRSHLSDELFFNFVPAAAPISIKGKKLTVFMVDTSACYHMGSRLPPGYERLMYTALYLHLPSVQLWAGAEKLQNRSAELSLLQQLAIKP